MLISDPVPYFVSYPTHGIMKPRVCLSQVFTPQIPSYKIIDIANFFESEVIDPFSLFPYRSFGHYNEKGYQLVGKEIIKKIAP